MNICKIKDWKFGTTAKSKTLPNLEKLLLFYQKIDNQSINFEIGSKNDKINKNNINIIKYLSY